MKATGNFSEVVQLEVEAELKHRLEKIRIQVESSLDQAYLAGARQMLSRSGGDAAFMRKKQEFVQGKLEQFDDLVTTL